ncbi:bifunctional non-homologous end joining protein LigD [Actinoalloteichus hoggarensis]|uniref:Putative ATP-dependent DNA ligase YkoU n=1 Tax=Actinoalloteichus hoggarensis TaxID=1470176 RepID=A0A221W3C1_9PSEU|nr:non-homologous end-joining DNA ligase [Actinoalloteichus hoggarensis]ASO20131.1 putative ATP-dependent DNA ligase YkoU [Actinoalloteichus hoggarensis]MBB5919156.1 bifunctional non-homologous end joining protein LigD [Actinoalloteichus hoggarensis]
MTRRERVEIDGRTLTLSNPTKVLYPATDERAEITKGEIVDYYRAVAATALPHLRNRLLTLRRYPEGIESPGFFQKDSGGRLPSWVHTVSVPHRHRAGSVRHVVCEDESTLVYLANLASLELHIRLCPADRPDHPDRFVVDLDPPPGHDPKELRPLVRRVSERFEETGLTPYVQTTGGKGFHVMAPLVPDCPVDEVLAAAREMAARLAEEDRRFTVEQRRDRRNGRVLLDVNRNGHAQTVIAPYSTRARPGAPVATPIEPHELARVRPDAYHVDNVPRRLASKGDPWSDLERHAVSAAELHARLS